MTRFLALLLLSAPATAANLPRNFTITSFDRIRVEAPYAVTLATGRSPAARAEGSPAALDAVDLRVENRTLILRQRSGFGSNVPNSPVRVFLSTPDIRTALLVGSGSLAVDKMSGLSVDVSVQGSGVLAIANLTADRVIGSALGSGSLELAGRTKVASLLTRGTATIAAGQLAADEVTLTGEGAGTAAVNARTKAAVTATGSTAVTITGNPACTLRTSGSATVSGCRAAR